MICFLMPTGTKFQLEVAKNLCSSWWWPFCSLKGKYEVKSNQNNFNWVILNEALSFRLFSKWSKLTQFWLNPYKVNFDSSCRYRYTFSLQFPFHFLHQDIQQLDKQMRYKVPPFNGSFLLSVAQKPKSRSLKLLLQL